MREDSATRRGTRGRDRHLVPSRGSLPEEDREGPRSWPAPAAGELSGYVPVSVGARSALAPEALTSILRRLFRVALGTSLGKAATRRSARWLTVAGGLVLLQEMSASRLESVRRAAKD